MDKKRTRHARTTVSAAQDRSARNDPFRFPRSRRDRELGAKRARISQTTVLKATLTGRYLHTTSAGNGTATITITASKVCWKFSYRGLDKTNDSGIHITPPPAAGKHKTSVFPFTATTSQAHQCESPTKWGPTGPSWLTKIAANPGRFYVIVATTKYPQGAIGGVLKRG